MKVYLLTEEQAESIKGFEFCEDSFFNPIQDFNNNWIISNEEVERCALQWVKELSQIDFETKITYPSYII